MTYPVLSFYKFCLDWQLKQRIVGHRSEFNSNTENSVSPYNSWIHLNADYWFNQTIKQIIDLIIWTVEVGCTETLFWATLQPSAFLETFGNRSF